METGKKWAHFDSLFQEVLPPRWFLLALACMVVFHFGLPVVDVLTFPWILLGLPLVIFGAVLDIVADKSFKKHHTTVKPFQESTALVSAGVFGFCRHPMYLGYVLILTGTAIFMGSLSPFLVVVVFAVLMEKAYIRVEEEMMAERFGEAWCMYADRVRKWI